VGRASLDPAGATTANRFQPAQHVPDLARPPALLGHATFLMEAAAPLPLSNQSPKARRSCRQRRRHPGAIAHTLRGNGENCAAMPRIAQ
jgi:hypothetical protein